MKSFRLEKSSSDQEIPRFLYWLAPLVAVASVLLLVGVSPILIGAVIVAGWIMVAIMDHGRALRTPGQIAFFLFGTLVLATFGIVAYAVLAAVWAA